jgi:hypothetical protein
MYAHKCTYVVMLVMLECKYHLKSSSKIVMTLGSFEKDVIEGFLVMTNQLSYLLINLFIYLLTRSKADGYQSK